MNIELKSEKVLELFDKYRKQLGLESYELNAGYDFEKEVFLKVKIGGNFTRLNYENCSPLVLKLVSQKDKEPYVSLSGEYSKVNIGFTSTKQLKTLTKFIDELLSINIHELPEYIDFLKMKEEEKKLEEEVQRIKEKLEKKQEEINKKLEELKKESDK